MKRKILLILLFALFGTLPVSAAVPVISVFAPTSGAWEDIILITGSGFTGTTKVAFNGMWCRFQISSDYGIEAIVPYGSTTGKIAVTNASGTATSAASFTVNNNAPVMLSMTPYSGIVGTKVTISGQRFSGATSVTFNGVSAPYTVSSSTIITTTVPQGANTGPVNVTTPVGSTRSWNNFKVNHYVDMSWMDSQAGVTFLVYRSGASIGPWSQIPVTFTQTTRCRDNNVSAGATYYYAVKAMNSSGQSPFSNVVKVIIP